MDTPPKPRLYIAGFFLLTLALLVFVQAAFNLNPFLSPSLLEPDRLFYSRFQHSFSWSSLFSVSFYCAP